MKKLFSLFLLVFFVLHSVANTVFADISSYSKLPHNFSQNYQSWVTIVENGIYIEGKYYTRSEFEQKLKEARKISSWISSRIAFAAIPSWYYAVAGVGTVAVQYGKEMIVTVGWAVVQAGTWAYDSVVSALSGMFASAAEKYETAKKSGEPTEKHSTKNERRLSDKWEPYSSQDLVQNGEIKQRRYFDENGDAQFDIDYSHNNGDSSHTFPHYHDWVNGVRKKWYTQ